MNTSLYSCFSFTRGWSVGLTLCGLLLASHTAEAAVPGKLRHVSARSLIQGYAVDPIANESLRPVDRAFLTKASETVRQQMRLGEVGVGQAGDTRVRSHAQQLVADYRSLNDALDALIRRKGGIAGAAVGGTSENYQKLGEKTGLSFDREFVRAAGQATDAALALFEQIVSETKDTDTRELAAAQLPILRAHRSAITELRRTFE
jgi:predicted outer membrane protein